MKSKFISLIVSVAVIVGLMVVPAVGQVAAGPADEWSYEVVPNMTKVGFDENFTVDVNCVRYDGNATSFYLALTFDPSLLQVTGVDTPSTLPNGDTPSMSLGYPVWNNVAGFVANQYSMQPPTNVPPYVNQTFTMSTIYFKSLNATGDSDLNFTDVDITNVTLVRFGATDVTNRSAYVNGTVKVGAPQMTVTMNPLIPFGNVTLAAGGISIAYNGSWVVPCLIPDTTLPYENITIYYNQTYLLPLVMNFTWDECMVVAALDIVPGWGFVSWTGDAGTFNFNYTHPLGFLVNGRTMKMDVSKSLIANFAPKAPVVGVDVTSLSFEAFEGISPDCQNITVTNIGGKTLNWTATDDAVGGWLSETPNNGSLTTSFLYGSQNVSVCADVTGKPAGTYSANVTISGSSSVVIPVSLLVKPATAVDNFRDIIPSTDSGKPGETDELYAGETFDVYVNFTAPPTSPNDGFNAIGLTDVAPDGWTVTVDKSWCWVDGNQASALLVNAIGNKAEIMLAGPYAEGTTLSVMYQVTVPTTATPGLNTWPKCGNPDAGDAWLEYYFNEEGKYTNCVSGEWEVTVTQPGDLVGETREVNSALLSDVDVRLLLTGPGYLWSDISTPQYVNTAWVTGTYWMTANLTRWYELNITDSVMLPGVNFTIDLSTPALLAAGNTFDFEGNFGLIPKAPSMSYALKSINLWKIGCAANPEWDLSEWKAMDVCTAWLYPS